MQEDATHTVSLISYVLHLIVAVSAIIPGAQIGPILLVVALILDLVKKGDAGEGWAAVLYLVTFPLWFFFILPGWLAWAVISIWFLYRIVLGWVRLNKQQPMDV